MVNEKYSVAEYERRFLLSDVPAGLSNPRQISDPNIDGTRLRVRSVETPEGLVLQRKLGHRRRVAEEDPTVIWHTSLYLNEAEYEMLSSLPGRTLTKTRWTVDADGGSSSVDVFGGVLVGLVMLEVDLAHIDGLNAFTAPSWAGPDVTHNETSTAGPLARLSADELEEALRRYEERRSPNPVQ